LTADPSTFLIDQYQRLINGQRHDLDQARRGYALSEQTCERLRVVAAEKDQQLRQAEATIAALRTDLETANSLLKTAFEEKAAINAELRLERNKNANLRSTIDRQRRDLDEQAKDLRELRRARSRSPRRPRQPLGSTSAPAVRRLGVYQPRFVPADSLGTSTTAAAVSVPPPIVVQQAVGIELETVEDLLRDA
jgi:hypothetical protein